ncbi:MAG: hypothetical protein AVDCRST_MAG02-4069 [uncultured Rubrobacteraceae bacterium]|uniref:Uncharacterized protein n=1 Tax=uncultured Rubrobacteraceae bacterium TaxID=349277 RepID=A0A6J4RJT5_9ACTN|nr:MAG: hypothetical protein AVDCRST_MAG02-4069 [uncultured Rubrobacteraceae bacterium]
MWAEIEKNLAAFETGVLNARDAAGYPYSVRCRPWPDHQVGVVRLGPVAGQEIQPGPASLLCHSHNEELWDLKVFLVRGTVEGAGDGLAFRPERTVTGAGLRAMVRMLMGARRSAAGYLKKRGLERPRIPWDEVEAVKGPPQAG